MQSFQEAKAVLVRLGAYASRQEEPEEPSPVISEDEEPAVLPSRPPDTCTFCGAVILVPASKFCWNCGANLLDSTAATAQPAKERGRSLRKRCMVGDLQLNSADEIVHCLHCGNAAHKDHLLEWLHVKRSCPICCRHLGENELKTQLDKRAHR